jgi:ABC-type Fe3+ transport system permease subunit
MKLPKVLPSPGMIIPGLVIAFAALYLYNRVPKLAAVLGNPNKAA